MILFPEKAKCCNCNGCIQICPKQAIFGTLDEDGFAYPKIDPEKCIDCGLCQKVCAYQHIEETNTPIDVFAAASANSKQITKSASGGIFAALATWVINNGGVVYGASMMREEDRFVIKHIGIENIEDLPRLQGSKYVQSHIGNSFIEIRKLLKEGRTVLFSGTPCQCAGLKGYLMGKQYENLYVVDLICHGVPSQKMFNDYINHEFANFKGITNFAFRDKTKGWELAGRIDYDNGLKHKFVPAGTSSYYSLFLSGEIYRENCYSCKYACSHRPGDLTIGDYWGIQKEHPELLRDGMFKIENGVSCIIANTSQGKQLLDMAGDMIVKSPSSYEKVARQNGQLLHPSHESKNRSLILDFYRGGGYAAVAKYYKQNYRMQRLVHSIFSKLPYRLKSILRKIKH